MRRLGKDFVKCACQLLRVLWFIFPWNWGVSSYNAKRSFLPGIGNRAPTWSSNRRDPRIVAKHFRTFQSIFTLKTQQSDNNLS